MEIGSNTWNKATLLIVDDEEDILTCVSSLLADSGYNVLTANCGKEAIRVFETHKNTIDLTLLDVEMPDMSGIEVLMRIKQISRDARVLFISGNATEIIIKKMIEAQNVSFIQKPFDATALRDRIEHIIPAESKQRII